MKLSAYDNREEDNKVPSLQIPDLPDDVYEALAFRAQAEHRSLAQQVIVELRRIPELTAREQRLAILKELKKRIGAEPPRRLFPTPEDLIREDRKR
jgi:plasmid stability protein